MNYNTNELIELGVALLRLKFRDQYTYEDDEIKEIIDDLEEMSRGNFDRRSVESGLRSKVWVKMEDGIGLVDNNTFSQWLDEAKKDTDFFYWNRYKKLLIEDKTWSPNVVNKLDVVSDKLVEFIGDPKKEGSWNRKGLLIGEVQSGKTSNYLAICNKAADVGFRIIILLTGTLENLRKQTQLRVDEGFTGRNSREYLKASPESKYIGVWFKNKDVQRAAIPFTSVDYDFNKNLLDQLHLGFQELNEPVILVVKKNKNVLENLNGWLSRWCTEGIDQKQINYPLLLIDDESDNASVNTSKNSITAINKGIRDILNSFSRSSYLAVTATPFANIFIDPFDDPENPNLFPKDYIYALSAPTNYIGANQLFSDEGKYYNSILRIDDAENSFPLKHKKDILIEKLPPSLVEAIVYFCLTNVIRDKQNNTNIHRSMLINVSRFVRVQNEVFELVQNFFFNYREAIQNYILSSDVDDNEFVKLTYEIFNKFRLFENGITWEELKEKLYISIIPTKIMQVNQYNSFENLDYEAYKQTGLRVIAIGGNSLSRGLTLEGLSVSYFYRNSMLYDALMQMGRWFGYRENYENLFKIYLPEIAIDWYKHITDSTNELRDEIAYMNKSNLTPMEFGLKVKQHQDTLLITARNKMRFTKKVEKLWKLKRCMCHIFLIQEKLKRN